MTTYKFLLDLALILLSTKLLGLLTKRLHMPQVVGALLAGLILGPAMLGFISETEFIQKTAEIGVVILMFCAGMETDIHDLKQSGKSSFVIAMFGVLVPLGGGFLVASYFNRPEFIEVTANGNLVLQNIFIGVILTATSVSITVETLKEMGKLKTRSGNAILGAAIIDDILGIVALTIISSMTDSSVKISVVLIKIVLYFIFTVTVGIIFFKLYNKWMKSSKKNLHRHVIIAFVFCLLMAYIAEEIFGVADITGAYMAGLILSSVKREEYLNSKFDVLSYLYLSPIFFASIGLKVDLPKMTGSILLFSVILVIVAMLSKVIGCGLGAKLCRYKNYQCARIGIGMISRGEVALIVASKGEALGLMNPNLVGPIVVVVILTTIVTPILLKWVFRFGPKPEMVLDSNLANSYERLYESRKQAE